MRSIPEVDADGYAALVKAAEPRNDEELFLALGGFGGPRDCDRVGTFAVAGRHSCVRLLADAWVSRAASDELRLRLGKPGRGGYRGERQPAAVGGWDVMFATSWRIAWIDAAAGFMAWTRWGTVAAAANGALRIGRRAVDMRRVREVQAYASEDLATHGVRLELTDGALVRVFQKREWAAIFDPTYDGVNVLADMTWTYSLTRAVGACIRLYNPAVTLRDTFTGHAILP